MYRQLADIYDELMLHVSYEDWVDLIGRIKKKYIRKDSVSLLEIGGGTGSLGNLLLSEGYRYHGSDISYDMCFQAIKKEIPFVCCDARAIPFKNMFDLIVFLYDGINYCMEIAEFKKVFNSVYDTLLPKGFFLFDITTEFNSKSYFNDFVDYEEFDDATYIRHSYYDSVKKIQHTDFTIFSRDEEDEKFCRGYDFHIQRIYSVDDIVNAIPKDRFSVVGIWDDFSFEKYHGKSERIHFLLQRVD